MAATDPLPADDRASPAPVPLPVRTTHVYDHPLSLAEFQRLPALPTAGRWSCASGAWSR